MLSNKTNFKFVKKGFYFFFFLQSILDEQITSKKKILVEKKVIQNIYICVEKLNYAQALINEAKK